MNKPKNKIKIVVILIILSLVVKTGWAITGTGGSITADGHTTITSFNATNTYATRGLSDYISGQFKFPSIIDILLRGRFSQLEADNTAPSTPEIESPANDTYQNTTSFTFSWTNVTDADNDTVSYRLEIYNDSDLALEYLINNSVVETSTPTQAIAELVDNQTYYWQVLANDSRKNSTFSENRTVIMDQIPPAQFNLTSPENGTSTADNSPALEWDATIDVNFDNYSIEVSADANFSNINRTENSSTNSFSSWSSTLGADTYYWRITAIDKANNQQQSDNNLSFTITAVTETQTITQGTTTVAGGTSPKPYSFNLIAPPSITILQGETITIPLTIQNLGNNINLNRIQLSAESSSGSIVAVLDKRLINTLKPNSDEIVNLIIQATGVLEGAFSVTVSADIDNPRLHDSVTIITNIIGEKGKDQKSVQQQLEFAKKFFDGNPQCSDLIEALERAEQELNNDDAASALEITSDAVNKCKDLIAIKVGEKPSLMDITMNAIRENRTTAIVSSEILAVFIILAIVLKKFIKRKPKQIKLDF